MKRYLLLFLVLPFVLSCDDDDRTGNNRYLPNYNFTMTIDMALPSYSNLAFTANPVYISQASVGINGIIVMNTGPGTYTAFEASCPNQELSGCSVLQIDGINAICPCDDTEYSLFTGLPNTPKEYSLKPYRVEVLGPTQIRVYN